MGATSVTGIGSGSSDKYTTTQLAILANGPSIIITQYTEAVTLPVSPSGFGGEVEFPIGLCPGPATNYIVNLTTINGGAAWITSMTETDGNFASFTFQTDAECFVMFQVVTVGIQANVNPM